MLRSPIHPGVFLRRLLNEHGLTSVALARHIGVDAKMIAQVCSGRKSMTATLAVKLSAAVGTTAEFWLNLQNAYALSKTDRPTLIKPLIRAA